MSSTSTHHNQPENLTSNHLPANATASQPLLLVCRLSKRAQTLEHLSWHCLAPKKHSRDAGHMQGGITKNPSAWVFPAARDGGVQWVQFSSTQFGEEVEWRLATWVTAPSWTPRIAFSRPGVSWTAKLLQARPYVYTSGANFCSLSVYPQRQKQMIRPSWIKQCKYVISQKELPFYVCARACVCVFVCGRQNSEQSNNPSLVMLVVGSALGL